MKVLNDLCIKSADLNFLKPVLPTLDVLHPIAKQIRQFALQWGDIFMLKEGCKNNQSFAFVARAVSHRKRSTGRERTNFQQGTVGQIRFRKQRDFCQPRKSGLAHQASHAWVLENRKLGAVFSRQRKVGANVRDAKRPGLMPVQ